MYEKNPIVRVNSIDHTVNILKCTRLLLIEDIFSLNKQKSKYITKSQGKCGIDIIRNTS